MDMKKFVSRGVSVVAAAGLGLSLVGMTVPMPSDAWAIESMGAVQASFADGVYSAVGKGIGGDVPVVVTITNGVISSVEVGDNSETQGIGSKAIDQLPSLIVESNTTEGIDAVAGATITSKAILTAVDDALGQSSQAQSSEAASQAAAPSVSEEIDTSNLYSVPVETEQGVGTLTVVVSEDGKSLVSVELKMDEGSILPNDYRTVFEDCLEKARIISVDSNNDVDAAEEVDEEGEKEKQPSPTVQTIGVADVDWLVGQQPLCVIDATYVVQDERYKALYPDMLSVLLQNNGADDIKDAVIAFVAWDANGLPVKIQGQFDFSGGSYVAKCNCESVNIVPGAVYGDGKGMPLDSDTNNIATFKATVVSYTMFDGTVWENPYFDIWRTMYEGKKYSDDMTINAVI